MLKVKKKLLYLNQINFCNNTMPRLKSKCFNLNKTFIKLIKLF